MEPDLIDVNDERVMTRFLLGDLRLDEQEPVDERLSADPAYFEALCALEDELILRWHQGELSADERRLFAAAYLSSPARRARVEAGRQLIEAARAWKGAHQVRPSAWVQVRDWLLAPIRVPQFAIAGTVALLVAAISTAVYLALGTPRVSQTETERAGQQGATRPQLVAAFVLAPPTDRGEAGAGAREEMNLVPIPAGVEEIQLQFEIADHRGAGALEAQIESPESTRTLAVVPQLTPRVTATLVTVAVAAADLPDGDYVLRLRGAVNGTSSVIAARAFRVTRQ